MRKRPWFPSASSPENSTYRPLSLTDTREMSTRVCPPIIVSLVRTSRSWFSKRPSCETLDSMRSQLGDATLRGWWKTLKP